MKTLKKFLAKRFPLDSDPKVSAHKDAEYPVNEQLREGRIGLIAVRNYLVSRRNNGDIFLDQWMEDALVASQSALRELDKVEEALGTNQETSEEVNKLLIERKIYNYDTGKQTTHENQGY